MQPSLLYATFPDAQSAKDVATALLENRLIACANILPGGVSLYRWEGKIQEQTEMVLVAKTTAQHHDAIIEHITHAHPSEVPAIIFLPIENGSADFLHWVAAETR